MLRRLVWKCVITTQQTSQLKITLKTYHCNCSKETLTHFDFSEQKASPSIPMNLPFNNNRSRGLLPKKSLFGFGPPFSRAFPPPSAEISAPKLLFLTRNFHRLVVCAVTFGWHSVGLLDVLQKCDEAFDAYILSHTHTHTPEKPRKSNQTKTKKQNLKR